jgi:hypothetical protein
MTKKIVATVVGLSMTLAMVPGMALSVTAEDLLAQIQELQDQLNELMAQYQALTGVSADVPAACTGMTSFDRDLYQGMTGDDVKCLQALLNTDPATQLAATGVGSAGSETTYFGPLTHGAVVKFQNLHAAEILTPIGLTAGTGYVGPATRPVLDAMLVVVPDDDDDADDDDADDDDGEAKEGTLAATAAAVPAAGATIYVGQTDVAVHAVTVKALGSDIDLNRLDIHFTSRPWLNISKITIYDGDTQLAVFEVTEDSVVEVTAGSLYLVRITGLGSTVEEGTAKTLTIKLDPVLVAGTSTATITYNIPANGIRGTDGVGIQQYAPSAALASRTFTIGTATGALALSVNPNNPKERAVIGTAAAITEDVELLRFDLKATVNDVMVTRIVTNGTLSDPGGVSQTMKLYDGDTLLAATTTNSSTAQSFSPLTLRVTKDTTKTLSIKTDLNKVAASRQNGTTSVSVATGGITAQDAGTFTSVTPSGSTAVGKNIWVYTIAPSLALLDTSIDEVHEGNDASATIRADAMIKFNVTAMGGDVYFSTTSIPAGVAIGIATTSGCNNVSTTTTALSELGPMTSSEWKVNQGETKWFTVSSIIRNASPTTEGFVSMFISKLTWGTTTPGTGYVWGWNDIQNNYQTSQVVLEENN